MADEDYDDYQGDGGRFIEALIVTSIILGVLAVIVKISFMGAR